MSFWRAFQLYHSHADPIWPDGTFNFSSHRNILFEKFLTNLSQTVKQKTTPDVLYWSGVPQKTDLENWLRKKLQEVVIIKWLFINYEKFQSKYWEGLIFICYRGQRAKRKKTY
jgi:hypothetical protein